MHRAAHPAALSDVARQAAHVDPADADRAGLIARAHARSAGFGLDARHAPGFDAGQPRALGELVDASRDLYRHALPVMETLHAQIANTDSMVLLTDSSGVILHSLGDGEFVARARVALAPGVSWSEPSKGTNAIGTALAEARPTLIHASEHFLESNHQLTCSCAPIASPTGAILGALDVSGDHRGFHRHTMALVRMSAQMIENHLFANHFPDALLVRFHARPEFVGTLFEGMAAFSPDGAFLAANRSGLFQLGLAPQALAAAGFAGLFGQPVRVAMQRARAAGSLQMLTLPSRVQVFARIEYLAAPIAVRQPSAEDLSSLRRMVLNCATSMFAVVEQTLYSKRFARGDSLYTIRAPQYGTFQVAGPGTIAGGVAAQAVQVSLAATGDRRLPIKLPIKFPIRVCPGQRRANLSR